MKVPYGDRSNVVIEPYLTDQWYVDAKTLAQPALEAVREGKTDLHPRELAKRLFRVARKHPALVHLPPALVGTSNTSLVWPLENMRMATPTKHSIILKQFVSGNRTNSVFKAVCMRKR